MSDEDETNEFGPLKRITLGGLEQLPGFSGDIDDYSFIRRVTFRGQKDELTIKAIGLREASTTFRTREDYDPKDTNSFLNALDGVLEDQGWFFGYITLSDKTSFRSHERFKGNLYSYNPSSKESESKE